VAYLVETYGIAAMKRVLAEIPYQASRSEVQDRFRGIYGVTLAESETAWLDWLDRWSAGG